MEKPTSIFGWLMIFFLFPLVVVHGAYNVINLGAKGDGKTDSTRAFVTAWEAACNSASPATIIVPGGRYLLNPITFDGPCRSKRIHIRISGTLLASTNYAAYSNGYWLLFNGVQGVSLFGGTLDGQGGGLWACKASRNNCPSGAGSLTFNAAKDIVIRGMLSINSQNYHIGFNGCQNVNVQDVLVVAPEESPNTDGIHVQRSTGVTITNTGMKTGDDCISIGPGTRNLWVQRVACGPGHGISIGSLAKDLNEEGVQNVTVKSVVFKGTQNGLRIKSWGRPSNGYVSGVVFQNVVMDNVRNPIIIDQNYCPRNENCPRQSSGVKITGVKFKNVRGSSASEVAVKFDCSKTKPCTGIGLQDVKLTYQNKPAQSTCINANGISRGLVDPPSCL